ncbi:MAG: Trp biosynthesis-associated membrane protein [Actinomycetota bacterium]
MSHEGLASLANPSPQRSQSTRARRPLVVLAVALVVGWIGSTQVWFQLRVDAGPVLGPISEDITGQQAVPLILAATFVAGAALAAMTVAPPPIRRALGVVVACGSATAMVCTVLAWRNPKEAVRAQIVELTGASRPDIEVGVVSFWLTLVIAATSMAMISGIHLVFRGDSSRQSTRFERLPPVDHAPEDNASAWWDALSQGDDPTRKDLSH